MFKQILVVAFCLPLFSGCASWKASKFDLSKLRDPRAADLDHRLSTRPEPVANPFGSAEADRP